MISNYKYSYQHIFNYHYIWLPKYKYWRLLDIWVYGVKRV